MNSHLIPTFSHHIQNLSCGYTDWLFAVNKHASQIRPWVIFQASYKVHFILEIFYTLGIPRTIMIRIAIMLDDLLNQFDHMFLLMRFERSVYEVNYMRRFPCGAAALQLIIRSCSRTPAALHQLLCSIRHPFQN